MTRSKANTGSTHKERKRIGCLKTAQDVARYMARCIRRAERGEGEENRHYKLVMMATMLLKAVEASDLEERISKLEQHLKGKQ